MGILAIVALVLLIVGIVMGIRNGEYRSGTFWFLTLISIAATSALGGLAVLGAH